MFKLSVLLVDSSSLLGLPGIGLMLTSCQSAGGGGEEEEEEEESGLDWEERVKRRGVMRVSLQVFPRLIHTQTHTHIWQR